MSSDRSREGRRGYELRRFERNRYFQGKLMTPRDMRAEQRYHRNRLETLTRLVVGSGIVHGLALSIDEDHGDAVTLTLEAGAAIDGYGRPVVVEGTTTTRLEYDGGDALFVYLSYDEIPREAVPVPGSEARGGDERAHNRTLEGFELSCRATPPATDEERPPLTFQHADDDDVEPERSLHETLTKYHTDRRSGQLEHADPAVFLGSFERSADGTWERGTDTDRRPLVYDNELLFAAVAGHLTADGDPHGDERSSGGTVPEGLGELRSLHEHVDTLAAELRTMGERLSTTQRYVMQKSLKETARLFTDLAERFEPVDSRASILARDIADTAEGGLGRVGGANADGFAALVADLFAAEVELRDALERDATEASHDRYVAALDALGAALAADDEPTVLELAVLQDGVAEAADSLERLYDVVPDGRLSSSDR